MTRPGRDESASVAEHRPQAKRRCMTGAIRRMSEAVALDERITVRVTNKSDAPTGPEHK
jgi:hypothetical protein